MKLILASASPRRAKLLADAGYQFEVHPAEIDEQQITAPSPSELAQRLAIAKAQVIADKYSDDLVLAADTVVCLGEQVMGKPADAAHARKMLELLSGTTQIIITGICLMRTSTELQQTNRVMSAVRMDDLTPEQIDRYIASGDWEGKAGGYGIQDHDPFVKRLSGSHTNIVGMPMETVRRMLARAGIPLPNQTGK
jgi:septum formation protein